MGFFDIFRKKKSVLTEEQLKWNLMWELWVEGKIGSPYSELMTYQSEINNGGHDQYFLNVGNVGNVQSEMFQLRLILPETMQDNLDKAYKAYMLSEEKGDDEEAAEILEECDSFFYENEEQVNCILEKYCSEMKM